LVKTSRTKGGAVASSVLQLHTMPPVNLTGEGEVIWGIAGENLTVADCVYLKSDGKYWKANATSTAKVPAVGIACDTVTTNNSVRILTHGTFRKDAWTWTIGNTLYVSTSDGVLTASAPATSGNQVQPIAVVVTAGVILFTPIYGMVEIV